jgi:hypothetical protein
VLVVPLKPGPEPGPELVAELVPELVAEFASSSRRLFASRNTSLAALAWFCCGDW